jgi:hypothetical protein
MRRPPDDAWQRRDGKAKERIRNGRVREQRSQPSTEWDARGTREKAAHALARRDIGQLGGGKKPKRTWND